MYSPRPPVWASIRTSCRAASPRLGEASRAWPSPPDQITRSMPGACIISVSAVQLPHTAAQQSALSKHVLFTKKTLFVTAVPMVGFYVRTKVDQREVLWLFRCEIVKELARWSAAGSGWKHNAERQHLCLSTSARLQPGSRMKERGGPLDCAEPRIHGPAIFASTSTRKKIRKKMQRKHGQSEASFGAEDGKRSLGNETRRQRKLKTSRQRHLSYGAVV